MNIHIPQEIIGAAWGFIGAALAALTALIYSLRSKWVPLNWGNKMNAVDCVTKEEMRENCERHGLSLNTKFESMNASLLKIGDMVVEIRERLARIEGTLFDGR